MRWVDASWAALAAAGLTVSTALAGCAATSAGATDAAAHAQTLQPPVAKPSMILTDTDVRPYDFAARTKGRLTLLYFGYTHCADECPTTMADIALALDQLAAVRARTTVVFVTTDPTRDTPAILGRWLAHYSTRFVGLTGSLKAITAAAAEVGIPVQAPQRQPDGTYGVNHGTQVLAFSPDGKAHEVFTAQATADDYARDLPVLLAGRTP